MNVFILIPFYNESKNIPELSRNLLRALPKDEKTFVFVDDCSTDETVPLLKQHFEGTRYQILTKDHNRGPGNSFQIGFEWILGSAGDDGIIVTMEADNTSDISLLPTMVAISSLGFDLVLASIYAQGGKIEKTKLIKIIMSFFANMTFRAILNIKVLTMSSFYRIYHVSLVRRIREKFGLIVEEKGFTCMLEILIKSLQCDAKVIEVPMTLKSTMRKDKSKMKIVKTTVRYLLFLVKGFRLRR